MGSSALRRSMDRLRGQADRARLVVLVGPDGSGKSSVGRLLAAGSDFVDQPINFRPRRIDRGLGRVNNDRPSESPHATPARSQVGAALKLIVIALDLFTLRWDVLSARRQGKSLLVERYAYDLLADPQRLGLQRTPLWFRRFVVRLAKRPDAVYCLVGKAEVMHERKPELTISEIQKQLDFWRLFQGSRATVTILDSTDNSADELARQIRVKLGLV